MDGVTVNTFLLHIHGCPMRGQFTVSAFAWDLCLQSSISFSARLFSRLSGAVLEDEQYAVVCRHTRPPTFHFQLTGRVIEPNIPKRVSSLVGILAGLVGSSSLAGNPPGCPACRFRHFSNGHDGTRRQSERYENFLFQEAIAV